MATAQAVFVNEPPGELEVQVPLGGAIVLEPYRGVDIPDGDVIDGRDAFAGFAASDELGDRFGADSGGEGGFAEAVDGVEDDGDGAAEGVEAPGVAGAVVVEVDLPDGL